MVECPGGVFDLAFPEDAWELEVGEKFHGRGCPAQPSASDEGKRERDPVTASPPAVVATSRVSMENFEKKKKKKNHIKPCGRKFTF